MTFDPLEKEPLNRWLIVGLTVVFAALIAVMVEQCATGGGMLP